MKRYLIRAGLGLVTLVALAYAAERFSDANRVQLFGDILAEVDTSEPVIALTFDDGPTDAATPEVLALLAEHGIKATFFVNGNMVERHPDAMRAIIDAGHEVGNHAWHHRRMMFVTPATVRRELGTTDQILRDLGYDGPLHFRPPYGRKLVSLPWVLSQQERLTVMWSVHSETFQPDQPASDIATKILDRTGPGDILLLHLMSRSNANSRAALPTVIEGLKDRGYTFLTVSELLEYR